MGRTASEARDFGPFVEHAGLVPGAFFGASAEVINLLTGEPTKRLGLPATAIAIEGGAQGTRRAIGVNVAFGGDAEPNLWTANASLILQAVAVDGTSGHAVRPPLDCIETDAIVQVPAFRVAGAPVFYAGVSGDVVDVVLTTGRLRTMNHPVFAQHKIARLAVYQYGFWIFAGYDADRGHPRPTVVGRHSRCLPSVVKRELYRSATGRAETDGREKGNSPSI